MSPAVQTYSFWKGGTAIYVLDPDSGERRPSTVEDVALNARMVEALDHIHLFTINVFPNEIQDRNAIDVNRFFHALDHTRKHVMGGVFSFEGCRKVVEMAQMAAGGPEALRAEPFVSFITLIISPLKIDKHYGDMTCYLAREGLPVVVPTPLVEHPEREPFPATIDVPRDVRLAVVEWEMA